LFAQIDIYALLILTYLLVLQVVFLHLLQSYLNRQDQKFILTWKERFFLNLESTEKPETFVKISSGKNTFIFSTTCKNFSLC